MADKLSDINKLIQVAIDTMKSKETMETLGKELSERIVKRTRLGKGVNKNLDPPHPLPQLKKNTVTRRKALRKKGQLTGPRATPAKSGLNRTGKMLNDVVSVAKESELTIKLDSPESNKKARDLIDLNRNYTFLNVSKPEFKGMIKSFQEILNKVLAKLK